jgi:hypothetical protein
MFWLVCCEQTPISSIFIFALIRIHSRLNLLRAYRWGPAARRTSAPQTKKDKTEIPPKNET